jgi:hypothetical protein
VTMPTSATLPTWKKVKIRVQSITMSTQLSTISQQKLAEPITCISWPVFCPLLALRSKEVIAGEARDVRGPSNGEVQPRLPTIVDDTCKWLDQR